MPIQNGRYVSPTWVNNGPPAIDQSEMQAITDTLESLDSGSGGGGEKRYASLVIGTSTNGWTTADCDYLCDGINDNVEIQEAINALPESGGELKFLSGNYQISSALELKTQSPPLYFSLLISGSGDSTKLNFPFSPGGDIGISAGASLSIKNISIQSLNLRSGSVYSKFEIKNCSFYESQLSCTGYEVNISGNNFFSQNLTTGQIVYVSGVISSFGNQFSCISNNIFEIKGDSLSSLIVINSYDASAVSGNVIYAQGAIGILASENTSVTGNYLYGCGLTTGGQACGNYVYGSSILANKYATVSGNLLDQGYITAFQGSTITGNSIKGDDSGGEACIVVYKADNQSDVVCTVISSNSCFGGPIGIFLAQHPLYQGEVSNAVVTGNSCSSASPLQINNVWSDCLITGNMFPNGSIVDNGTGNVKANNFTES